MRVRNWLLAGTSLTLMMLAPGSMARAQDAAVAAAVQAYQADKSDDNKKQLNAACIAAGFQSLDECIASLKAPAEAAPAAPAAEAPAAPAAEAPAAPAAEAPAAPAAEAPADAAPAPKKGKKTKPSSDEQAPAAQEQAPAQTEAAPAAQDQAPAVEAPAPAEAAPPPKKAKKPKPSSEEQAPAQTEQAPAPVETAPSAPAETAPAAQPSAEQQAAPSTEPAPAPESSAAAPAAPDVVGQLTKAVDAYNAGVASLTAGKKGAQRQIDKAKGQIDSICQAANMPDTNACLAQFGLTLSPLPAPAAPVSSEAPAVSSEQPATAESSAPAADQSSAPATDQTSAPAEQPSASQQPSEVTTGPVTSSEAPTPAVPVADTPQANETVSPDAVEPAPSSVAPDQLNSLFDADKTTADGTPRNNRGDRGGKGGKGQPGASSQPADQSSSAEQQPAAPTTPTEPPKTVKDATADLPPPAPEQKTALGDKSTGKLDLKGPPGARPPKGGNVQVVDQPKGSKPDDGSIVFKIGINIFINNNEQERNRYYDARQDKIDYDQLQGGRVRETVSRPDGSKVVTVYGQQGEVLQRSKITPKGREIVLSTYDPSDTSDLDNWRDPGDDLPPLHVNIKARDYILDSDDSSEQDVLNFLDQPPVEKVRRIYSVDEVKRSARLRDTVRRLEIGGLTFDTGKATIARSQVDSLANVADAMLKILDKNPGASFLIEGHTDAVGSDVANLVLSDQRASTVARILTDFYEIPAENLVTQGYGESFLKVKTDGPEPLNRRVVIKNITPLVSYSADAN